VVSGQGKEGNVFSRKGCRGRELLQWRLQPTPGKKGRAESATCYRKGANRRNVDGGRKLCEGPGDNTQIQQEDESKKTRPDTKSPPEKGGGTGRQSGGTFAAKDRENCEKVKIFICSNQTNKTPPKKKPKKNPP